MPKRERNRESGYALLLIFAMAAVLAIMLYKEVPRVAFEAQRDKEQLLVDRGQEYQRAVALFVRKYNRFPGSMDELENTNRERYLRRKFVDPMTGKADWRVLHAGPGGVITDSVTAAKRTDGTTAASDPFGTAAAAAANNAGDVNLATRRRPTDGADPGAGGDATGGSAAPNNGLGGYNGPVMVLPDGRIVPANAAGTAPSLGPAGASGRIGSPLPGMGPGGIPGQFPGQIPGQPPLPSGVAVQQGNTGIPGVGNPPSSAAGLINQILTTPRPGGINGPGGGGGFGPPAAATAGVPTGGNAGPQQQVIGAGIAGVASTKEQEGIKTVNDRSKYNEWEFVYDITKDPARQGAGRGAQGGTGGQGGPGGRGGPNQSPTGFTPQQPPPGRGGPGR